MTHGIPFLEIYKDLCGRDYFKRQEEVVNELAEREKAERSSREMGESQAKTEDQHAAEADIARSIKPARHSAAQAASGLEAALRQRKQRTQFTPAHPGQP